MPTRPGGDLRLGAAVAGMQAMLAETVALFAPNFHAYRRFAPDQFTPVTPDWAENNRSVAFRVPASSPENRRIEHRAAGAEAKLARARARVSPTPATYPSDAAAGDSPASPNTLARQQSDLGLHI